MKPVRRLSLLVFLLCLAAFVVIAQQAQNTTAPSEASPHLRGFTADHAQTEWQWEQKFLTIPDANNLRETMRTLSAQPHHLGSQRDFQNAQWILAQFKNWGVDAHIEQFEILFPTPRERLIELLQPEHYVAKLKEPAIPEDPDSADPGQLPTYNAYSAEGDVTSQLVYVNYGVPADYDQLARLNINVKGKIVIARYGSSWRGIKPKVAYEHGAIGCIIYSDPHEDGYFKGDIFPKGAYRPWEGVQRGSVIEMEIHPGDPETPGWGAVPGARRLSLKQADTLEKIPVLPISYEDALPLLKSLAGPVAPEAWRGSLPTTYHIGPGPGVVHLVAHFNWNVVPAYDVIATIPGSEFPDEWVIRGNHHDAWVNGASDPISGQSPMLEQARATAELLKQGWRPKRTIVFAAWDGEEPALMGSTEWVETHAAELSRKAVVYINSDSSGKGHFEVSGSHTLEPFVNDFERDATDPLSGKSVWLEAKNYRLTNAKTDEEKKDLKERADLRIEAMGSGSDYSPFLQHLGIASLSIGYAGADGGVYHSIYDDFYWYTHFSDTTFADERSLAQIGGVAVMRLADADVLPFNFTALADTLSVYQKELAKLVVDAQGSAKQPPLDLAPLAPAITAVAQAASQYDQAYSSAQASGHLPSGAQLAHLDDLLFTSERALTDNAGLPRRPWYKHQIYAPGFYTGYGVKTLPGIREAIEQKNWAEAARERDVAISVLQRLTQQINSATALLK